MMAVLKRWALLVGLIAVAGCTGLPEDIEPVTGFESDRYLGTWYEIARLDHSFDAGSPMFALNTVATKMAA